MRRRQSTSTTIKEASRRFRRRLLDDAGGRLPRSVRRYCALAHGYGIVTGPMQACPDGFTGRLWYDEDHSLWVIGYNPRHTARQKMRYILHELAEWFAVNDFPSLFDDLPGVRSSGGGNGGLVYYYDGGGNPDDLRHRIAREVERLSFRR